MIRIATFAVSQQQEISGTYRCRSNRTNPEASPMERPFRFVSHGRQGPSESSPSEANPYRVMKQRLSTPPATTASHRPASIQRDALANTLALDEQAVEMEVAGPVSRK